MSFYEIVSTDPLIAFEFATLLVAFAYFTRLVLSPSNGDAFRAFHTPTLPRMHVSASHGWLSLHSLDKTLRSTISNPLRTLFSVGGLISTPKRSLRHQRLLRG